MSDVRARLDWCRTLRRFGAEVAHIRLRMEDAEALYDLADGARRWIDASERMDINEVARAEATIRAALARLDGENTG